MNPVIRTDGRITEASLSSDSAAQLLATGGQLVDVRSPTDFVRNALPGALNLPIESLCYAYRRLNRQRPVIVYGASEFRSRRVAHLLAGKGFARIYHLSTD
jgi:rhodanese-related sulfurtransferase